MSPKVQIMAMPVPFSGSARWWARTGTSTSNSGVRTVVPNSGWKRTSSGWATIATQLASSSGRVVSMTRSPPAPSHPVERELVVGAGDLAVLHLGLRDGGALVDVVQRGRVLLVGLAAGQVAQERALADAAGAVADGGVEQRPVDRQAEAAEQVLERLLVEMGDLAAQLDEVGRLTGTARWSFGHVAVERGAERGSYGSDGSQRTPVKFCTRRSVARPLSSQPIG